MPAGTRVARSAPHANQSVRPSAGARMAGRRTQCLDGDLDLNPLRKPRAQEV